MRQPNSFSTRFILITLGLSLSSCSSVPYPDSTMFVGIPLGEDAKFSPHNHHSPATLTSMTAQEVSDSPHWLWTSKRPNNLEDQRKAEKVLQALRSILPRYRDYRMAVNDGYRPFLHNVPLFHYHFLSHWRGAKEHIRFNPEEPTAILYRKTAQGFELEGVMYTAGEKMTEEQLHDRIPLSVGQWHAHINICFPSPNQTRKMDWSIYGLHGTIATEEDCHAVGGQWFPRMYGWMIHVFPFENSPEKVWGH